MAYLCRAYGYILFFKLFKVFCIHNNIIQEDLQHLIPKRCFIIYAFFSGLLALLSVKLIWHFSCLQQFYHDRDDIGVHCPSVHLTSRPAPPPPPPTPTALKNPPTAKLTWEQTWEQSTAILGTLPSYLCCRSPYYGSKTKTKIFQSFVSVSLFLPYWSNMVAAS